MKQKLTLTVERAAVQAARRAARREGTSISGLFERAFRAGLPQSGSLAGWLADRRAEGVRPVEAIPSDERYEHLRKKYARPTP